jgi:hypothetical protein
MMRIQTKSVQPGAATWIAALAALCNLPLAADFDAASLPATSPHWREDRCGTCHAAGPGGLITPSPQDADATCLSCHDGVQAVAEAHPIGRFVHTPGLELPSGWPTAGGRLSCLTCHDVTPACRLEPPARAAARVLLRRAETGARPGAARGFCAACHVDPGLTIDPHLIRSDVDRPAGCAICHLDDAVAPGGAQRSGNPGLRGTEPGLCLNCHDTHSDYFEPGHVGAVADAALVAALAAGGARLPLGPGAVVQCSTCHNPHGSGTFAAGSDLTAGELDARRGVEGQRLRGLGSNLCGECHGR